MRLVATSDTHTKVDVRIIPDGDVFLHVGDLMTTGYPDDFKQQLEWLAQLPHKIKLYVPGNHDFHLMVYPGPALQDLRRVGVTVLGLPGNLDYDTYKLPNGMKILGLPYVKNLPRWAFSTTNPDYYNMMRRTLDHHHDADIIASHSPPIGYLDVNHAGFRLGMPEYVNRDFYPLTPKYWFCGHVHEGYGHVERDGTHYYNVAMSDRAGNHANPPVVLDI